MSKIWGSMLVISIVVALFLGTPDVVISSIMESSKGAVQNIISLASMVCFWSGIFNILEKTD